MLELLAIAVPVAVTGLGGYIHLWVKSATTQEHIKGLRELINERFDGVEESQKSQDWRLVRIEKALNGHLRDY